MPLPIDEIKKLIKESIPDASIEIKDLMGDNNHYSATIRSELFKNLNPQLYIKKEFIGGCDIVKEMFEKGELKKLLIEKKLI